MQGSQRFSLGGLLFVIVVFCGLFLFFFLLLFLFLGLSIRSVVGIENLSVRAGDTVYIKTRRLLECLERLVCRVTEIAVDRAVVEAELCQTGLDLGDLVAVGALLPKRLLFRLFGA